MRSAPVNTMDVKRRNRSNTLRCLLQCEKISQPELAQKLNLSWPTVLQNVKELSALGLVQEVGSYESTGGRKARAYAPVLDARLAVGLDITQNHIGLVLVDLSGQVLRYTRQKRVFSMEELDGLGALVDDFLQSGEAEKLLGVGISLPGIVSETGDRLLYSHALKLYNVETAQLCRSIAYPCLFLNDANAGGLAELWKKPEAEELVYLSLSNTVGGAIVSSGQLYAGANLRAGEFGHMTLVPGGRRCYCGKVGCVDAYLSAKVLSSHTDGNLARFFQLLREGEPGFAACWETYLDDLAVVLNNLRMSFDCEIIVGGYIGPFLEEFGGALEEKLASRNTFEPDSSYRKPCFFKLEAAAVGAALLHVERFLQSI